MKIQYIAVIFIIIMLPLTLLIGNYMQLQIANENQQLQYDNKLFDSTMAGIKAFELNTVNNRFSQVADSLKRDVEAAINTFIASMANNLGITGTVNEDLLPYIPAALFTLYDGYYIYSPTWSEVLEEKETTQIDIDGNEIKVTTEEGTGEYDYENLLKPYIYYTTRYVDGEKTDFVVNYTLDNYMIVYGNVQNPEGTEDAYVTKSGFLSAQDYISFKLNTNNLETIIKRKILEYILPARTLDNATQKEINAEFEEAYSNGFEGLEDIDKISLYSDVGEVLINGMLGDKDKKGTIANLSDEEILASLFDATLDEIFENDYDYIKTETGDTIDEVIDVFTEVTYYDEETKQNVMVEDSDAKRYYIKSLKFTMWVNKNIGHIEAGDAVDEYGNAIEVFKDSTEKMFDTSFSKALASKGEQHNNPELKASAFNQHRVACIQHSIQSNLNVAISQYNVNFFQERTYNLTMPILQPEEWDRLTSNVSLTTFLQGLQVGTKVYNNYVVVSSNKNQETINVDDIYYVDTSAEGITYYHEINCDKLGDAEDTILGMKNIDYDLYKEEDENENKIYTYDDEVLDLCEHTDIDEIYGCYYCIVNKNHEEVEKLNSNRLKAKYTAIAKEKNNLYKVNDYYNIDILSTYVAPPVTILGSLATYEEVELGDYVNYSGGGYNHWRVLTKDEESGIVTIISDGCVESITLSGRELNTTGNFFDFIIKVQEKLTLSATSYRDDLYSIHARILGSDDDGQILETSNSREIKDIEDMRIAKVQKTNNDVGQASGYWILSAVEDDGLYSVMRMPTDGSRLIETTLNTGSSATYGIRVIVKLSHETMVYDGNGTASDPWELILN